MFGIPSNVQSLFDRVSSELGGNKNFRLNGISQQRKKGFLGIGTDDIAAFAVTYRPASIAPNDIPPALLILYSSRKNAFELIRPDMAQKAADIAAQAQHDMTFTNPNSIYAAHCAATMICAAMALHHHKGLNAAEAFGVIQKFTNKQTLG